MSDIQEKANKRAAITLQHLIESNETGGSDVHPTRTKVHQIIDTGYKGHHQGKEALKWNGWGYEDTEFKLNNEGDIYLSGKRYWLSGVSFPKLRAYAEQMLHLDIDRKSPANKNPPELPPPNKNSNFLQAIEGQYDKISFEAKDRLFHAHGHTCDDIWRLRYGSFPKQPDVVIWPGKHEHVEAIVKAANEHNVAIIPFGGGTSVSLALEVPTNENRMVVSIDMHEMNRIKWVDYESMIACIESGVIGKDLDAKLAKLGLCLGHEPDSSEFSSLGGWIATRASGMKKSTYGNIEDILISCKIVTPIGTLERGCLVPRISSGPDLNQIVLGSEGTLGVITEAVLKLRPLPEVRKYGSIIFPDFESGVACLRELAKQKIYPTSIRLMDNMQFTFGQVLKPGAHSRSEEIIDSIKKWYVTKYKGFDVNKMCAATLLFEGNHSDIKLQMSRVYSIAATYGGLQGGEENGRRGYFLTYMIAYMRDFAFNYYFIAESFETSVPWANVLEVCTKVKERIVTSCKEKGVIHTPWVTCRVTQSYDSGACVYFYFGFVFEGLPDPLKVYTDVETDARNEIIRLGGSISHHHGIGKIRKQWMKDTVDEPGIKVLQGVKSTIDPKNIFASGNLI